MEKTLCCNSIIDMREYFAAQTELNAMPVRSRRETAQRVLSGIDRAVTTLAAVVMAGCLGICTLLFLTML